MSKNRRLDLILQEDPTADPLQGNYTLVKVDGIIAAFQGADQQVALLAATTKLASNENGSLVQVDQKTATRIGSTGSQKKIFMCAADFTGDGKEKTAVVYSENGSDLWLSMADYTEGDNPVINNGTAILLTSESSGKAWVGCMQPEDKATLLIVWKDPNNILKFWTATIDQDLKPQNIGVFEGPKSIDGGVFDLATGIFLEGNIQEIALFYQGTTETGQPGLLLSLYTIDSKGLNHLNTAAIDKPGNNISSLRIKAGAFLSHTIQDSIALGWVTVSDEKSMLANLETWQCTLGQKNIMNSVSRISEATRYGLVEIAVGDIDTDGVEELIFGTVASNDTVKNFLTLQLFKFTNNLELTVRSKATCYGDDSYSFASVDFKLAIGSLENQTGTGIVIAALGTDGSLWIQKGYAKASIGVIQVQPDLQFSEIYTKSSPGKIPGLLAGNIAYDPSKKFDINIALSIGDYSGKSLRVGKPIPGLIESVNSIVAIINILPLQQERLDDGCSVSVNFEKSKTDSTSLGLQTSRSYTSSDQLGLNIGLGSLLNLTSSINNTYGKDFSKSTEKFKSITTGISVTASNDDFVILNINTYNTWEYPVFDQNGKQGHILVIFPQSSGKLAPRGAREFDSFYRPQHLLQQVLSYPVAAPADFDPNDGSFCNVNASFADENITISANWNETTSNNIQKSYSQTLNISKGGTFTPDFLDGFNIGLNFNFEDSYTKTQASTEMIQFTESTVINMNYNSKGTPVDAKMNYHVTPYVYWSTEGKYLKVDYSINIPRSSTWFYDTYKDPDPAFHKPWTGDSKYGDYTRDIGFIQRQEDPEYTDIYVTVHNDTFGSTEALTIAIYDGLPTLETKPLATQIFNPMGPRSSETGQFERIRLPTDVGLKMYAIYAVINPSETLKAEITTSNKIAYGIYPPSELKSQLVKNN